ncbi:hypothetical protein [Crenobacter cavernae]|uniref:Tetratricopeptide repeat protein n=1 Tax=Crenobacter cavernae TaxID=2290923 RepID=A0ABY0FCT3_9NEIS|nr:hypothetical protein [Crenobacter cavernae]RXZ42144.1 hypothetical protein EBB06_13945 [Crenobacter cavernae]
MKKWLVHPADRRDAADVHLVLTERQKKIDDALLKNPALSEAQLAEVQQLRTTGEALHKAGKHQEAVDTLDRAIKIFNP